MPIAAESTQTTPTYYEPEADSADPDQHRLRVLIDEAATLRGLTIQLSLRLMALAAAPDEKQRRQVLKEFRALQTQFKENMSMLFGTEAPDAKNRAHIDWIRTIAGTNAQRRAELSEVEASIQRTAQFLENGQVPTFEDAREFFDTNWPVIRDRMTEVIWDLWADLDAQKIEAVNKNAAFQTTLQETLADIKKFSSAIRMIAINTAVLATRPQDAGAGFQAISREVKSLSEEIDASTTRARKTIESLM